MGLSHSPKAITNNLLFYVDAANIRSYPGSGTAWMNLMDTSISTTLYGSPTYASGPDGSFTFDGSNLQYSRTTLSNLPLGSADRTIIVAFNPFGNPNSFQYLAGYGGYPVENTVEELS